MKSIRFLHYTMPIIAVSIMLISQSALSQGTWPGGSGSLYWSFSSWFEPSGLAWNTADQELWVVGDDGYLCRIDDYTGTYRYWTVGGDLEAITFAEFNSGYVYLGVEDPDSIVEFSTTSGALTGKSWDLTSWMKSSNVNKGLEALTFVPNGRHPYPDSSSGGLFYAGLQDDGKIYVFDVDLSTSGNVSCVDTITPDTEMDDISGLHFHRLSGVLYAIFDGFDILLEMRSNGRVIAEYDLPGRDQEGIALTGGFRTGSVFIADDGSYEVFKYGSYPMKPVSLRPWKYISVP